jgi:quercetin dioxygenase-like cupin family protein
MALPHASLFDVVNVAPLGEKLIDSFSTSLIKTEQLQLLHLVLPARQDMPEHHVNQQCVLHCLEGEVEVMMAGGSRRLRPGELVVLPGQQRHSVQARADSALLVTLLLDDKGDAGHGGGAGSVRASPA